MVQTYIMSGMKFFQTNNHILVCYLSFDDYGDNSEVCFFVKTDFFYPRVMKFN